MSVHSRYDHKHRPAILNVKCPKCSEAAIARKSSEEDKGEHIMDLAGTMYLNDWVVRCPDCGYLKENIAFDDLPPLYYQALARSQTIWGWNREHFVMLLKVLEGEDISKDKYAWSKTYIRGEWLKGSTKTALAKAMRKKMNM